MNPGSIEARAEGCLCPIIDNCYGLGRGQNGARYGWYISGNCQMHGKVLAERPSHKPARKATPKVAPKKAKTHTKASRVRKAHSR